MSALPDRYGESGGAGGPPQVVTNNFIITISFLVGACGVAIMGMSLQLKTNEFFNFGNYVLEVLDQTPFVVFTGYAALLLGLYGIVTGCVLGLAGLFNLKAPWITYIALFMFLLDAAAHIGAGVVVQQGITMVDDAIYKQTGVVSPQGSFTSRVIHMQISMFNGCCVPNGWSVEFYVPRGDDSPDALDRTLDVDACTALHRDNPVRIPGSNALRTCYTSAQDYAVMNYTVSNNLPRICDTLAQAMVNIDGKKIPGTSADVASQTKGKKFIPIVGNMAEPVYGCGIGYAKAFQAAMLIWVQNILSPIATAFIACGVVELLLLMLAVLTQYACSRKRESSEEAYARYMEELATGRGHQPANTFEHQNPNRPLSVNVGASQFSEGSGSRRMSIQQQQDGGGSNRMSMKVVDNNGNNGSLRMSIPQDPNAHGGGSRRMSIQSNPQFDAAQQQQQQRPMSVQRPMSMQGGGLPPHLQQQYYQQQQQQQTMVAFNVDDKI